MIHIKSLKKCKECGESLVFNRNITVLTCNRCAENSTCNGDAGCCKRVHAQELKCLSCGNVYKDYEV